MIKSTSVEFTLTKSFIKVSFWKQQYISLRFIWNRTWFFLQHYFGRHLPLATSRSSRPEVFCKEDFLRNFVKFTGKHLCQSLFFNKVAGLRPATLLKKRLWHRCFPVNLTKFLRTPFFIKHLWWLLLYLLHTWDKLNVRKTFRRRLGHPMCFQFTSCVQGISNLRSYLLKI